MIKISSKEYISDKISINNLKDSLDILEKINYENIDTDKIFNYVITTNEIYNIIEF